MNTIQSMFAFVAVFLTLCMFVVVSPLMYRRTYYLADISISSLEKSNKKDKIFEFVPHNNIENHWTIETGSPEKAYRLARGLHDSVKIILN
ncbi:MAG: hypothetical protein IKG93_10730 [Clostridiales bacterium]|nr:hypothetical protein [Clostridiales bacterium]